MAVELNVLCLGLEGAGKSTLLATLSGESTDNIEPTSGDYVCTCGILNVCVSV